MATAEAILPALTAIEAWTLGLPRPAPDTSVRLTTREHQALQLVAHGLTIDAVARRLGISPSTARKHVERLYTKLDRHDRLTAITCAKDLGLIS